MSQQSRSYNRRAGNCLLVVALASASVQAGLLDLFTERGPEVVERFLPAERAFIPSVTARDARTVVVHWQIADGYYLYRDRFSLRAVGPAVHLLPVKFSRRGRIEQDPTFGRLEVYDHDVDIVVPVDRQAGPALPIVLEIAYQGCAEKGYCYPPSRLSIDVVLPALTRHGGTSDRTDVRLHEGGRT